MHPATHPGPKLRMKLHQEKKHELSYLIKQASISTANSMDTGHPVMPMRFTSLNYAADVLKWSFLLRSYAKLSVIVQIHLPYWKMHYIAGSNNLQ